MKDHGLKGRTDIRRSDRAIEDDEWKKAFLHRASHGMTASVFTGQPYVNTHLFAYDEAHHAIVFHTAKAGRLRANIEQNPKVCFTVNEIGRMLPADKAGEFGVEYASLVIFGKASIIEDTDEAKAALQLLLDKYFAHLHPGEDYEPTTGADLKSTTVYRVSIEEWTGKTKQAADDFPGAFTYPR